MSTSDPAIRRRWNASVVVGVAGLSVIVVAAVFAPVFLTGPAEALGGRANLPPSPEHWLGTDRFGRDILARSLVAARLSLTLTVIACAISAVAGTLIGTAVWFAPARIREVGLRAIDIAVAYPSLLLTLVVAAILGPGSVSAVLAIGIGGIPVFARIAANLAGAVVRRDFVVAAELLGVTPLRVLRRHVLPNMAESLLVLTATSFALVLVELSGLSFLGLGVQPPDYDFGSLLSASLATIYTQPYQVIGPAAMIVITGLSAMLIGDGIAAGADPRSSRKASRPTHAPVERRAPRSTVVADVEGLRITADDGTVLVADVSFTIGPGEIVGIVGESGSGKSLTAMAMAQLLPPELTASARCLAVGGLDLAVPVEPRALVAALGLVYQDPSSSFNPVMRMGAQLTEVLRVHRGLGRRAARQRIARGLEAVHLREPERIMAQHPHQLSGGMRQRAMIAGALSTDPRLIIADEPTTALDVTVQAGILRELAAMNDSRGTAIMLISHDIGVVGALCSRVLVMRSGTIVEELAAADLRRGASTHPYTRKLIAAAAVTRGEA
ncbi:dipeptide/oligopeptide/nickel ABC transporter permease/ATP-binding protein [Microbacterium sp. No. 7]|uniref:dipeptide/oligopeptide/nickel ABC transporter permease/ATP-binding protein n=1 Tax=Microbacterium sp. No. 7 TaxID=1714373 RepID=UPI0006D0B8A0|nr:dipeptide/oligopeptide/nickel ABC transporter permease/ATP-binding protein [Microbacterium sp. No. 7]ALJ20414.1 peptide ABC transporter ATP-binding protein [Microbacterium sp. No. 7]